MPKLSREDQAKMKEWRAFVRQRPEQVETPGPGQESVWDYPRPPRVDAVSKLIRVEFGGELLAESERALRVVETASPPVYYLPPEDVRTEFLAPSGHSTLCEWKGRARYWHVQVGEQRQPSAVFSYPDPMEGFEAIAGYMAFYSQKMSACFAGQEQARPQAGPFYAGWITSAIVGPFKGDPGTEAW